MRVVAGRTRAASVGVVPRAEVLWLIYRLVVRVLAPPEAVLRWSRWRRLHQARAMRSHYRRRDARPGHLWK